AGNVQSGIFAGAGGTFHRYSSVGDGRNVWGVKARIGYEFPLNSTMVRVAATYERRFDADRIPGATILGFTGGLAFPLYGEAYQIVDGKSSAFPSGGVSEWYLTMGTSVTHTRSPAFESSTTINIPEPYIGAFTFIGFQRRLAVGARATFQYLGASSSTTHVRVLPRVEYHSASGNFHGPSFKAAGHMVIDNQTFDGVYTILGGTQLGFGGDVSLILPRVPTSWTFGLGVNRLLKDSNGGRPAATELRLEIGLDRYLFGK
ncbi:MAG TPA: hypothetical protein VF042_15005, partial [Gemmatimonadaceae bacterium]